MAAWNPRANEIFLEALEAGSPAACAAILDRACGPDFELRRRVEALLRSHEQAGSFLGRPAAEAEGTGVYTTAPEAAYEGPGSQVGPYKLLEPIGEGGMGTVWMAQQTEPVKRLVAVKLIKLGMDSKQVIARFEAERQALALMDHANIARVLDGGTTSAGRPYFVMDLVKGMPITKHCDEHHLTPRQRLELFIPVCEAVQHAHQKGIIHRDLKPSNVLVALYDGRPVPKVIDFGVAKAMHQPLTEKTLVTGFGNIVGTLEYMSPEQAEVNQLDIDTRSDVYSLGVLLYELLTGSPPFTRKELEKASLLEMLRVIREKEPSKPSTKLITAEGLPTLAANRGTEPANLTRLVRGELDWIVMKALEKDRSRRYETANGFALDVQRYLADEPVLACPPSVGYRLRKFALRNMRALVAAGLFLFLLVLLGGATGWYLRDQSTRRAITASTVEQAVAAAEDLSRKGRLPEAVLSARAGQALLDSNGGSDELRQRVRELLNDLDLAERLEEARLEAAKNVGGKFDDPGTLRAYASAFREFGLDVESQEPAEIAGRIRRRSIQGYLMQALDHWAGNRLVSPDVKKRLSTIIAEVDADPWRDQARAAQSDAVTLKRLAVSPGALSQSPASLCLLGEYLHRQGEAEAAVRLLAEAQRRHADDFWVNYNLGSHLMHCRPPRWDQAVRFFSVAVGLRPQSPGARVKLGWALERTRQVDEAIATLRVAVQLKPTNGQALVHLGHLLATYKQDYDGAIAQYSKAHELYPKDVSCLAHRAFAYFNFRRFPEALADCDKLLKLEPTNPGHWYARAGVYAALGQRDKAIANHSEAIRLRPDHHGALRHRGELYFELNEPEKAISDLSKVLELSPQDWPMRQRRGGLYRKLRQWDLAIADYSHLIDHPTGSGANRPWKDRGWVFAESGRFLEAAADFAKAVEKEPAQTANWYNHAVARLAAGDRTAYRAVCTEMLKRFANTTDVVIARHVVSTCVAAPDALDDPVPLVKLAEVACSKDRTSRVGLLGAAYYRAGQPRRALECFTERPRTPPRAWDWCFQALAHHRVGQAQEAHRCLNAADKWLASVGPPGPDEPGKPIPRWDNWQDESGTRLIRREAEARLKAPAGSGKATGR